MCAERETLGQSKSYTAGRYAAIDIGTVTTRMLVADVDTMGSIHEVQKEYAITNLGEGVDATHRLLPAAIKRTASVVERYCEVRDSLGLGISTIAMATSASRDAENAAEFVHALAKLGVTLTVIPGEMEASLSFQGASSCFAGEDLLVSDIGGGSTELVIGCARQNPAWSHSFNVGCRRVTEKFLARDPFAAAELQRARMWVYEQMAALFGEGVSQAAHAGVVPQRLVAVAGTATTVVSVRDAMKVYDSARVHGQVVTRAQLDEIYERLSAMTLEQRQQVVGLDPRRAPVIVAGFLILRELMTLAGVESFTVSENDILHGMILRAATGA